MKINRADLLAKLLIVRPGLTKKEIIEQSTSFVFTGKEIVTHNGYISIRCPFVTDFQCSVVSAKFYSLLKDIEDEFVDITVKDKEIQIKSNHVRSGMTITVDNIIEKRLEEIPTVKKWKDLPKDFIKGLYLCMFSASKDAYCGAMNCISISEQDIFSTDNLRISHFVMEKKMSDKFLIPLNVVIELVKYKMTKYSLSENSAWIQFTTNDGTIFSSKCLFDTFPDASSFFDVEGIKVNLPKKIQTIIDTVSTIIEEIKDIDKRINVGIDTDKIICRAEQEKGWIEKEMEIKHKGKKVNLTINPIFLYQILDKSSQVIIGEKQALFITESFKHVMALPMDKGKKS